MSVQDSDDSWLDPSLKSALRAVLPLAMPPASLALYARWWQLETWLRDLLYVELRSLHGRNWEEEVPVNPSRVKVDATYEHMSGLDNENPLAYLDYSELLLLIEKHWTLTGYALPPLKSWIGRNDELARIRHRIGHVRRAHADDLNRLEQVLRDLEPGAFKAFASYNRRHDPDPKINRDPVSQGWLKGNHPVAERLIEHAAHDYEIGIVVRTSRRPWVDAYPDELSRAAGVLWHVEFILRGSTIDPAILWRESALERSRHLVVHMTAESPGHVGFTFAAVDDPEDIADAIGAAFDAVIHTSRRSRLGWDDMDRWTSQARAVNYRVVTGTGWNIVDQDTLPITIFGTGGAVVERPIF